MNPTRALQVTLGVALLCSAGLPSAEAQSAAPSGLAPDGAPLLCPPSAHPPHPAYLAEDELLWKASNDHRWLDLERGLTAARAAGRLVGDYKTRFETFLDNVDAKDLAWFDPWCEARPQSALAHLLCGMAEIDSAWDARGSGWANEVSDDAWRLFAERLDRAARHLKRAAELDPRDPWAPTKLITVAMGGGIPKEEARAWFERAVAIDARHVPAYEAMMRFLTPRWHGTAESVLAFVEGAVRDHANEPALLVLVCRAHVSIAPGHEAEYLAQPAVRTAVISAADRVIAAYPSSWSAHHLRQELAERLQDPTHALEMLEWRAASGYDVQAESQLADLCLRGAAPLAQDTVRGIRLMCRAAHHGDKAAQLWLGRALTEGGSAIVPRDDVAAYRWLASAADQGDPIASCMRGLCLSYGRGVAADPIEARRWLQRAAEAGATAAFAPLATMCWQGLGGPKDPAAAERWLQTGIRAGVPSCALTMGELIEPQQPAEAARMYRAAARARTPGAAERLAALLARRPDLRQAGDPR